MCARWALYLSTVKLIAVPLVVITLGGWLGAVWVTFQIAVLFDAQISASLASFIYMGTTRKVRPGLPISQLWHS
ncbi:hypothetical protein CCP3SC15_1300008 [Gammaproteobacteria bacterium]